jgi:hypothetical protein
MVQAGNLLSAADQEVFAAEFDQGQAHGERDGGQEDDFFDSRKHGSLLSFDCC